MPLMPWTADLELGREEDDLEHHVLIDGCNDFHTSLLAGDLTRAGNLLEQLIPLLKTHCEHEEAAQAAHAYPLAASHATTHRMLARAFEELRGATKSQPKPAMAIGDVERRLLWLEDHIKGTDSHWVKWVSERQPAN